MANRPHRVTTTTRQIEAAVRRARRFEAVDRRVTEARYDATNERLCMSLQNGIEVCIPRSFLQGLESASEAQLSDVELVGNGTGLHWPELDVDHYVPGLLDGIFGTKRWMAELGRRGGTSTSAAKAAAARANGRKGGRPSKVAVRTSTPRARGAGKRKKRAVA